MSAGRACQNLLANQLVNLVKLLIQRWFNNGAPGRIVILGAICYQIATKIWQVGLGLNRKGSTPSPIG
jgi:hypothetical protein